MATKIKNIVYLLAAVLGLSFSTLLEVSFTNFIIGAGIVLALGLTADIVVRRNGN